MAIVSRGVLKLRILEYFRRVEQAGEERIVTDHHKPVLRVMPIKSRTPPGRLFDSYQGTGTLNAAPADPETGSWGDLGV